jgi:hypothetical protein
MGGGVESSRATGESLAMKGDAGNESRKERGGVSFYTTVSFESII